MEKYTRRALPLAIAVLAITLASQLVAQRLASPTNAAAQVHSHPPEGAHLDMVWRFRPKTFQEGRDRASLIVLVDVVAVERAQDLVGYHPQEPGGETRYPAQRITLNALKVYRGQATAGQQLTLFQTGGVTDDYSVPRFAPDNPQFQKGERYVLLLEPAAQDLFRIIAPEGRYRLERGGTVTPVVDNAVTRDLRGKPLKELEQRLFAP